MKAKLRQMQASRTYRLLSTMTCPNSWDRWHGMLISVAYRLDHVDGKLRVKSMAMGQEQLSANLATVQNRDEEFMSWLAFASLP